ncbi:MAG: DUF971 domain-containing protein [Acidobacteriota bacterium]|nr:DUF971 domain-containing protein [Acidobacteriota bacterium]
MQHETGTSPAAADPEHIAISKSAGIKIDWRDGHHSDYSLAYLRDECPCATCTGAHGTEPQRSTYSKPEPFPMFKPALKMNSVEPVGQYAVRVYWNDGHSSGIYSFEHLRKICPCEKCQSSRTNWCTDI